MKKFCIAALSVFGMILGSCLTAQAVLITHDTAGELFYDDFESVGPVPCNPDASLWTIQEKLPGDGDDIRVIDSALPGAVEGSHYLELYRCATAKSGVTATAYFAEQTSGSLHVEFIQYQGSKNMGNNFWLDQRCGFKTCNPTSGVAGGIDVYEASAGWFDSGMTFTLGRWVKFEIDFTFDPSGNDTWILTVDDVPSDPMTYMYQYSGGIDNVAFKNDLTRPSTFFVDSSVGFTPPPFPPGDADRNWVVDERDAAILAENWLATSASWGMGDFNDDRVVNDLDATMMAANWSAESAASLPEPSIVAMLFALALMGVIALRNRSGMSALI